MDEVDPAPVDRGSAPKPKEQGLPAVGDVLGAYRVLARIGSGGMAVIYRAEHVRLSRQVALKVLRPSLASRPASLKRFLGEARAVNEIGHPNIIDIIDIVEDGSREPPLVYMVMELLAGHDLHTRIARDGPLPLREVVDIASQVADALTAAHAENILHRDLKPSNVFLAQINGVPTVKLLDFGLLKHFGGREPGQLTRPEVLPGTPLYMSPEQIMGDGLDQRTDVYGYGLVLYEMLAASPPFVGKQNTEVLVMHAKEPPPSLLARRPDLPLEVDEVVLRCLEKDPKRRYTSVAEACEALARAAAGEPGRALPTPVGANAPASARTPELPGELSGGSLLAQRPGAGLATSTMAVPRGAFGRRPRLTIALALAAGGLTAVVLLLGLWSARSGDAGDRGPPSAPPARTVSHAIALPRADAGTRAAATPSLLARPERLDGGQRAALPTPPASIPAKRRPRAVAPATTTRRRRSTTSIGSERAAPGRTLEGVTVDPWSAP